MAKPQPRERILRIVFNLLEQPGYYTKKQLGDKYEVTEQAIKEDFKLLRAAGLEVSYDENYRYFFAPESRIHRLKELMHFTEEEQIWLDRLIIKHALGDRKANPVQRKLAQLYDYQKLGLAQLRRPYLHKIELLEQGKVEEKVVCLKNYRSSTSNRIADRYVEGFQVDAGSDTLQAYDLSNQALRHFRLSRAERIQVTDQDWTHKGKHYIKQTDAFRIVNDSQVMVHFTMELGGRNHLIEQFPQAESAIVAGIEEGHYDFQAKVNDRFYGLSNFLLGYHQYIVEIHSPDALKEHIADAVKKIQEKLGGGWKFHTPSIYLYYCNTTTT